MRRSVEAEILADSRRTKMIVIDHTERACINCQRYEPYMRENRGNIACRYLTSKGYCLQWEEEKGALHPVCGNFLKEEGRNHP